MNRTSGFGFCLVRGGPHLPDSDVPVGLSLTLWLTLFGSRLLRRFGLGPPTVLHPLLSLTVRALLVPLSLGNRVILDLCRRPCPTVTSWVGRLDSRIGPSGVPNGRLNPVEVRNVDHHIVPFVLPCEVRRSVFLDHD